MLAKHLIMVVLAIRGIDASCHNWFVEDCDLPAPDEIIKGEPWWEAAQCQSACNISYGCVFWMWDKTDGDGYCKMYTKEKNLSKQTMIHGVPFKFTGCLKNKENQAYGKMASKRSDCRGCFNSLPKKIFT